MRQILRLVLELDAVVVEDSVFLSENASIRSIILRGKETLAMYKANDMHILCT